MTVNTLLLLIFIGGSLYLGILLVKKIRVLSSIPDEEADKHTSDVQTLLRQELEGPEQTPEDDPHRN